MKALVALDIERLDNTSFATAFGEAPVSGPTDLAAGDLTMGCLASVWGCVATGNYCPILTPVSNYLNDMTLHMCNQGLPTNMCGMLP